MFFKRLRTEADEFYHIAQVESFFSWVKNKKLYENKIVFVNLPKQTEFFKTNYHPLKKHSKDESLAFIMCATGKLQESLRKCTHAVYTSAESWHCIAYATGIEIWENKEQHDTKVLPLRFGFTKEEKKSILMYARQCIENSLKEGIQEDISDTCIVPTLRARGTEIVSLDVATWIDGVLRSSIIVQDKPFLDALKEAGCKAVWDTRMKPVELDEVSRLQIEISIFSDIKIPLRRADYTDFGIDGRKGYFVSHEERRGWYLPTVFNCVNFSSVSDMTRSLIYEKAHVQDAPHDLPVYTFLLHSIIENPAHTMLTLTGTVVKPVGDIQINSHTKLIAFGDKIAEWLCRMQDSHGGMPLFADPLQQKFGRIDWVRLGCATHALATYGVVRNNTEYISIAKKSLEYLVRYMLRNDGQLSLSKRITALIYCARAARSLKNDSVQKEIIEHIEAHWDTMPYAPISGAIMASLLGEEALCGNKKYTDMSIAIADRVYSNFIVDKYKATTQLASYPELSCTFRTLFKVTENSDFLKKAHLIEEWLIGQQLKDGSFPGDGKTIFAYTRGTGKIFEVLAQDQKKYAFQLAHCLEWLLSMQYTDDSMYFIQPQFRSRMAGSLRNNFADPHAWIDGSAHTLLGIARLLDSK